MKKLMLCAALGAALAASAWDKVVDVRVVGLDQATAASVRLGQMLGNPMYTAMLPTMAAKNPYTQFLGPTRPGASVQIAVFSDMEVPEDGRPPKMSRVVLYPVLETATAKKFLKNHVGAVQTNGAVCATFQDKQVCLRFAPGWVAMGECPMLTQRALDGAADCRPLAGNTVAAALVTDKGMGLVKKILADGLAKAEKGLADGTVSTNAFFYQKSVFELVQDIDKMELSLSVSAAGLDADMRMDTKPDGAFAPLGRKVLPKDALAFAGKNAAVAMAQAADCGNNDTSFICRTFIEILASKDVDTSWLTLAESQVPCHTLTLTFDAPAMMAYMNGPGTNVLERLDKDELNAELMNSFTAHPSPLTLASPEYRGALLLKGAETAFTPAERLAATLPECADKPVCQVAVGSLFGTLRQTMPSVLPYVDAATRPMVAQLLAGLPTETAGGVAMAVWREDSAIHVFGRLSADEVKAGVSVFNSYMALQMTNACSAGSEDDEDADCGCSASAGDDANKDKAE